MKKIMIAALGLSLLPGASLFAQDTSQSTTDTSSTTTTMKKHQEQAQEGHGQHGFNDVFNVTISDTSSST